MQRRLAPEEVTQEMRIANFQHRPDEPEFEEPRPNMSYDKLVRGRPAVAVDTSMPGLEQRKKDDSIERIMDE